MNGNDYLLDTNFIIGFLKRQPDFVSLYQNRLSGGALSTSQITRIELLSFPGITPNEEKGIHGFLDAITALPLSEVIEAKVIELRRALRLRLPDAIILATAVCHGCALVTMDKDLISKAQNAVVCVSP